MKVKHKRTLENYRQYGEGYTSSINYEDPSLKFIRYGKSETTRPTERLLVAKVKQHNVNKHLCLSSKAKIALCGASIINGLQRYSAVWNTYFPASLNAINLGIGGDRVQHILWRIEDMLLPKSLNYLFVHCGTNNLLVSCPRDICDGILAIGVMAKKQLPQLRVIIGGVLPCDMEGVSQRAKVAKINSMLKLKARKMDGFYYMDEDFDWVDGDGTLDMAMYRPDCIHLTEKGNKKFANTIINKLKQIESETSSVSFGEILRIPSSEVPRKITSQRESPPLSSSLHHHADSPPSPTQPCRVSPHPSFTEVPKSVYDHDKQLRLLSSRHTSFHYRPPTRLRPRNKSQPLPSTRLSSSGDDDKGDGGGGCGDVWGTSSSSRPEAMSQPPSSSLLSSHGDSKDNGSGYDILWSCLRFLMMVLASSFLLPYKCSRFVTLVFVKGLVRICSPIAQSGICFSSSSGMPSAHKCLQKIYFSVQMICKVLSRLLPCMFLFFCVLRFTMNFTDDVSVCEASIPLNVSNNFSSTIPSQNFAKFCILLDPYVLAYPTNRVDLHIVILPNCFEMDAEPWVCLSILKCCLSILIFFVKILIRWIERKPPVIHYDRRNFIRKHKRHRQAKIKLNLSILLVCSFVSRDEEKVIFSHNGDFFTIDFIEDCKNIWESSLRYHSICYAYSKRPHCRNELTYLWLLIYLSGDIERHPGPINYQLQNPNLCGYYRAAIFSIFKRIKLIPRKDKDGKVILENPEFKEGLNDMKEIFGDHFSVQNLDWGELEKRKQRFMDLNSKWGRNNKRNDKNDYYDYFSAVNWVKLDGATKKRHSLECSECQQSCFDMHAKFLSTTPKYEKHRKENVSRISEKIAKSPKLSKGACKEVTNEIVNMLDDSYTKQLGVSFKDCYKKCYNLVEKPTYEEKRTMERNIIRETKNRINEHKKSTAIDRHLGGRKSDRAWDRDRMKESFESIPETRKRTSTECIKIDKGIKKPKNHVGKFDAYNIDKESLENVASSWTSETTVSFKKLGEQFVRGKNNEIKGNFGQVVKEYLKDREKSGFTYTFKGKDDIKKVRYRRAHKRIGHNISMACDIPAKKVRLEVSEKIRSGDIEIGENIVQREYKKLFLDAHGNVETQTFMVNGRKIPLQKIRVSLFKKHSKYMRLNNKSYFENIGEAELRQRLSDIGELNLDDSVNEMKDKLERFERSRHFMLWHDASEIVNHSHMLFTVHVMYDPAVFFTSEEYKAMTGYDIDIQKVIETPEIYIVGRCKSNDEQLGYIDTRVECLKELKNELQLGLIDENLTGISLNDSLRMFKGDGPAVSFEGGNQKNGYYFCPLCDVHKCLTDDISHCYQQHLRSIEDLQKRVLKGSIGKRNALRKNASPFDNLSVSELRAELIARNVDIGHMKSTKKDLHPVLKKTLRGTKRVPVLLFQKPTMDLKQLGLSRYELSMVECMHDIAGHIDNILEELPHHLKSEEKLIVNDILQVYYAEKNRKRCCDKRKILLYLTKALYLKINGNAYNLLKTLSEIQRILYLGDKSRNAKNILRLHLTCFRHFVYMKKVFRLNNLSEKMSRDRLYGKYQHNLLVHAPLQYHLICGETINCEDEERKFSMIQSICKNTTNNHPGHVIGNVIVREQAERNSKENHEYEQEKNSILQNISRLGKEVENMERDSFIDYVYIQENSADWQTLLELISSYLIFGEGVWWKKGPCGITFFDFSDEQNDITKNPKVHHFRSSIMKDVVNELKRCWSYILEKNIPIPIHEISTGTDDEPVRYKRTTFLGDKIKQFTSNRTSRNFETNLVTEECVADNSTDFVLERVIPNKTNVQNNSSSCANLSSNEANAILFVLGEVCPLLQEYDARASIIRRCKNENRNPSDLFMAKILDLHKLLKEKVIQKQVELRSQLELWERSFIVDHDLCAPVDNDIAENDVIADINNRIDVSENILSNWDSVFN